MAVAILPPVVSQEVWAAGVTYYRSRDGGVMARARIPAAAALPSCVFGGMTQLFFKATGRRSEGISPP